MVKVTSLTQKGLGELADGTLVERVLPEENVDISDGGVRVLTPSPDRVKAPCRHFKTCGGCQMQHASDAFVARWKAEIVTRAMASRNLPSPIRKMHVSPAGSRRRVKFGARKTKTGATIGFHGRGTHTLVDTPDCALVSPSIAAARPTLVTLARLASSRREGVALHVTATLGGLDVRVETQRPLTPDLRMDLSSVAVSGGLARLTWDDEPIGVFAPPEHEFGRARAIPPPGAFLQATQQGQDALVGGVKEAIGDARSVVDLFSGCGTFSLPLAERADVHAVEGEESLLAALDAGWRSTQGLHKVSTERRDLFRRPLEPDELDVFDAAVIDPPRAGAAAQVETLARSTVSRLAMVSCNPITFARDAQVLLANGFHIDWVDIVDQFRWSPHVELVSGFTRL